MKMKICYTTNCKQMNTLQYQSTTFDWEDDSGDDDEWGESNFENPVPYSVYERIENDILETYALETGCEIQRFETNDDEKIVLSVTVQSNRFKIVLTRQYDDVNAEAPYVSDIESVVTNRVEPYSKPLSKRINALIKSDWETRKRRTGTVKQILELCELSLQPYAICAEILESVNGNLNEASIRILNESTKIQTRITNPIIQILYRFEEAISNLHNVCLVCGKLFNIECTKPTVCDSEICTIVYEGIGYGFSLREEVISRPEILDLSISLLIASIYKRRMLYVRPIDVFGIDKDGKQLSFRKDEEEKGDNRSRHGKNEDGELGPELDINLLLEVIESCPSVADMRNTIDADPDGSERHFENFLDEISPLLRPLLRWLITSNRSYIRYVPEEERIPELGDAVQFMVVNGTPAKTARFRSALSNAPKPSRFAFHGSGTENWHSILRTGLKNMSHTKYMTTGAAYGSGIYLADNIQTSLGYSQIMSGWKNSMFGPRLQILGLAEIAERRGVQLTGDILVVNDEDCVSLRYLIVYTTYCSEKRSISASTLTIKRT